MGPKENRVPDSETDNSAEKPIRVLYANAFAQLGGAERSLLDIVDTLDRTKVKPAILLFQEGPLSDEVAHRGIPVHYINMGSIAGLSRAGGASPFTHLKSVPPAIRCGLRIAKLVRRGGFHVFHSNSHKTHYLSTFVRCLTRSRIVWHLRDLVKPTREGRIFTRMAGRIAHKSIANSRATRASLGENTRAFKRCVVVPNAIDIEAYAAASGERKSLRGEWGFSDENIVILHAGIFCPFKGQHIAIESFKRVLEKRPGARLVLAGDDLYATGDPALAVYKEKIRRMARELELDSYVHWAGFRDDMPKCYAAADILVSTSTTPEPFGRSLVEAMAARLPVVAFDEGGPSEIVVDGETGCLAVPGSVDSPAEALVSLCGDKDLRGRMGSAGFERAKRLYNRSRIGADCLELYRSIL